jgi:Tfp pilus assembly major pilin PilA
MRRKLQGFTLIGLMFWSILIASVALVTMKVFPTVNEYYTILRAVNKIVKDNSGENVPALRVAFDRQKDIEYSISSISGKDLNITKENDKVVISFAYDKEIELVSPVFLLIKYQGRSK